MRRTGLAALGLWMAIATTAGAEGRLSVTLPDVSGLTRPEAEALIAQLAKVNVITSNCPEWTIDDGAWALLTGTGDKLAAQLGMDPAAYDDRFYGPAFELLDDPSACARIGPEAAPLIARLEAMGGSTGGPHKPPSASRDAMGADRSDEPAAEAPPGPGPDDSGD